MLRGQLIFSLTHHSPVDNLIGIGEPDRIIVIFKELTLHAQHLDIMQLGNEVCHLHALHMTVLKWIRLDELDVFTETSKVVHDLLIGLADLHRSIELDYDGLAEAAFRFKACLYALVQVCLIGALAGVFESTAELMISKQLNIGLIHRFAAITFCCFIYLTYDYSGVWFGAGSLLALGGIRVSVLHKVSGRCSAAVRLCRYVLPTLSHTGIASTRLNACSIIITLLVNFKEAA